MSKKKILFRIEQDEDGYPPYGLERVWASETSTPGQYRIENYPFFARDVAYGDIVSATTEKGELLFEQVISRSGNSLIRVIVFAPAEMAEIVRRLSGLGCGIEVFPPRTIAVNIPASASLLPVQEYLADLEQRGAGAYEEAVLGHE